MIALNKAAGPAADRPARIAAAFLKANHLANHVEEEPLTRSPHHVTRKAWGAGKAGALSETGASGARRDRASTVAPGGPG